MVQMTNYLYKMMGGIHDWLASHQLPYKDVEVTITFPKRLDTYKARLEMRGEIASYDLVTAYRGNDKVQLEGLTLGFKHKEPCSCD